MKTADVLSNYPFSTDDFNDKWYEEYEVQKAMEEYVSVYKSLSEAQRELIKLKDELNDVIDPRRSMEVASRISGLYKQIAELEKPINEK